MPTYQVTAPDGRTLRLTGATPPTDADLDEVFGKLPPQQSNLGQQAWESTRAGFDPAYSPNLPKPKNFGEKLLQGAGNAIGSLPQYLAGSLAGGAGGAAVGTMIAPGPGTIIGTLLGGALGMGGVGAGRETYRQALTGPSGIEDPGNIAKQGAIDTLMGLIFHGAGKLPIPKIAQVGTTGLISAGASKALGGSDEEVASQGILGSLLSILPIHKLIPGGKGTQEQVKTEIPKPNIETPQIIKPRTPGYYGAETHKQNIQGITPNNLVMDLLKTIQNEKGTSIPKPVPETGMTINELTGMRTEALTNVNKLEPIIKNYDLYKKMDPTLMPKSELIKIFNENKTEFKKLNEQIISQTSSEISTQKELNTPQDQTPSNQELAMKALEKQRLSRMPKPAESVIPKPGETTVKSDVIPATVIDTPIKQVGPIKQIWRYLFDNVNERVSKQGVPGQQLAKLGSNLINEQHQMRGMNEVLIEKNIPKLTPKQSLEAVQVLKNNIPSVDPLVNQAVEQYRQFSRTYQKTANEAGVLLDDITGQPVGNPETYFHHTLNEAGRLALSNKPNTFFEDLAKHLSTQTKQVTPLEARTIWTEQINPRRTMTAGFEKAFKDLIPPQYLETDLTKSLLDYNKQFAERVAIAKYFGPDYKIAKDLAAKIGQMGGDESVARNYIDQITGKDVKNMPVEQALTYLIKRQVHTKLSGLSALVNVHQGYVANTNMYGNKYAIAGMLESFTKKGKEFARQSGTTGKGFYSELDKSSQVWARTTGFPITEDFNFKSVANATKLYANDMYKRLQSNPMDSFAAKKLDSMGINWKDSLLNGKKELPVTELAKGAANQSIKAIMPKVPGSTPEWAKSGLGRATYTFWHYQLQQPKFLMSEFEFGKVHGAKRLLSTLATAGIVGEPIADLLALMRGEDRPDDIVLRVADNASTVIGGAPLEIMKQATKYGGFGATGLPTFGGPVVQAPLQSGSKVIKDLSQGRPDKGIEDLFRMWLRGDVPVGPQVPSGAQVERLIPRITQ